MATDKKAETRPAPRPWMTDEQIQAFAEPYLVANPDATHVDVVNALRTPRGLPASTSELVKVCERLAPLPTLATMEEAREFLAKMASRYEWVAVFWDRGWGDNGEVAEITVIQDGNGQIPLARVTSEVYKELRSSGVVEPNSLRTFKARRVHDFQAPPPAVSETEVRAAIKARFAELRGACASRDGWAIPADGGQAATAQRYTSFCRYFGGEQDKPWAGVCVDGDRWMWWAWGDAGQKVAGGAADSAAAAVAAADDALSAHLSAPPESEEGRTDAD